MSSRFVVLNPCSKRWDDLEGESRERFCATCQTPVHDIEQYSTREWKELWTNNHGHVCGYRPSATMQDPRSRRSVLLGALLTAVSPLMAQNGQLRIRVIDRTGAVIPGAAVELLLHGAGVVRTSQSDPVGEVVWADLPVGEYQITVSQNGFKKYVSALLVAGSGADVKEITLDRGEVVGFFVESKPLEIPVENSPISQKLETADNSAKLRTAKHRWWLFGH